ncbi:hypothetical protein DFQ28_009080 [Apophysomyces sp. BC1034]|nr:hypothetical protein DFQ29_008883 [Apophysomyces sp. BC1021]KAG0173041.1 hypothetical protein DFQ30_009058 [Apophysomyces sp. BC1015]KAG0192469.1 hypothetical protein DFQ28_009080 [Apophysomyces sp. BC1034]
MLTSRPQPRKYERHPALEKKKGEDESNPFFTFSRRIAKVTSMHRPVDIQLGIAATNASSRRRLMTGATATATNVKLLPTLLMPDHVIWKKSLTIVMAVLPRRHAAKSARRLQQLPPQRKSPQPPRLEPPQEPEVELCTSEDLEKFKQLVEDVLAHMDSYPDRTAMSPDLDELRPKLEAYINLIESDSQKKTDH